MKKKNAAKCVLDFTQCSVLIMPDLLYPPPHPQATAARMISLEIKPKCGLPPCLALHQKGEADKFKYKTPTCTHTDFVFCAIGSIKASCCRFQLQQHLKLKQGKIARLGAYCPVRLFHAARIACNARAKLKSMVSDVPDKQLLGKYEDGIQQMVDCLYALCDDPQNNLSMHVSSLGEQPSSSRLSWTGRQDLEMLLLQEKVCFTSPKCQFFVLLILVC